MTLTPYLDSFTPHHARIKTHPVCVCVRARGGRGGWCLSLCACHLNNCDSLVVSSDETTLKVQQIGLIVLALLAWSDGAVNTVPSNLGRGAFHHAPKLDLV